MSSIAVAGPATTGMFTEDMFDEGQKLAHPYHRTKFESEKLVREQVKGAVAHLPPGDRRRRLATGEMDKIDGPYYFFKVIQKVRHALPEWFPLDRARGAGRTSCRSTTSPPRSTTSRTSTSSTARPSTSSTQGPAGRRGAEHVRRGRPRAQGDADRQARDRRTCPRACVSFAMKLPALKQIRAHDAGRPRHPRRGRRVHRAVRPLRRARHRARAARAPASSCRRSRATPRSCGTTGSASSTPTCTRTARSRAPSTARRS